MLLTLSLFAENVEEIIRGLMKVAWERVDVDFSGSIQRFLAHNTIQASYFFSPCGDVHLLLFFQEDDSAAML